MVYITIVFFPLATLANWLATLAIAGGDRWRLRGLKKQEGESNWVKAIGGESSTKRQEAVARSDRNKKEEASQQRNNGRKKRPQEAIASRRSNKREEEKKPATNLPATPASPLGGGELMRSPNRSMRRMMLLLLATR